MDHQNLDVQMVRAALQRPLLGRAAQLEMAVRPRPGDRPDLPNPCPREAAVLMLLYPRQGELVLPLTQRTDTVEMHRGQVSLPGGAREPQDRDFAQTALRETCEELGIPEGAVQLLGALSPLYIPPSQFCVYPYVGYVSTPPLLHPDPAEVAAVIEMPLRNLLEPDTRQVEVHWRNRQRFEVPIYRVAEQRVWGATAMMLAELVALLRAVQAPTQPTLK
jgi:8-oxo-dGTP pyrophosphatase MutT (NUDIX family)